MDLNRCLYSNSSCAEVRKEIHTCELEKINFKGVKSKITMIWSMTRQKLVSTPSLNVARTK